MYIKSFKFILFLLIFSCFVFASNAQSSSSYFVRFKVIEPVGQDLQIQIRGYRHAGDPWYFPIIKVNSQSSVWSDWIDLSGWNWHGKINRSGGIAEYPSISLTILKSPKNTKIDKVKFEVELSDAPSEKSSVIKFTEESDSDTIIFLAPFPLRENAKDFETATQMIERQTIWAKEATGGGDGPRAASGH